jgi:hypothetical protein
MRKRLITPIPHSVRSDEQQLDLNAAASIEVTSEEQDYPVESALISGEATGWRADKPGSQTIRVIFDEPQRIKRILLEFDENETKRTQEFVLRCSSERKDSFKDIMRQQWNFSPPETVSEVEEYRVELSNVTVLELIIIPDICGGMARASLKSLRVF